MSETTPGRSDLGLEGDMSVYLIVGMEDGCRGYVPKLHCFIFRKNLGLCLVVKITACFLANKSNDLIQSTFEMFLICHVKAIIPLSYLLGVVKSNKFMKAL